MASTKTQLGNSPARNRFTASMTCATVPGEHLSRSSTNTTRGRSSVATMPSTLRMSVCTRCRKPVLDRYPGSGVSSLASSGDTPSRSGWRTSLRNAVSADSPRNRASRTAAAASRTSEPPDPTAAAVPRSREPSAGTTAPAASAAAQNSRVAQKARATGSRRVAASR